MRTPLRHAWVHATCIRGNPVLCGVSTLIWFFPKLRTWRDEGRRQLLGMSPSMPLEFMVNSCRLSGSTSSLKGKEPDNCKGKEVRGTDRRFDSGAAAYNCGQSAGRWHLQVKNLGMACGWERQCCRSAAW